MVVMMSHMFAQIQQKMKPSALGILFGDDELRVNVLPRVLVMPTRLKRSVFLAATIILMLQRKGMQRESIVPLVIG
jgi:hypothetical protein